MFIHLCLPISSHSAISVNNLEERIECVCNLPWFLVKKETITKRLLWGVSTLLPRFRTITGYIFLELRNTGESCFEVLNKRGFSTECDGWLTPYECENGSFSSRVCWNTQKTGRQTEPQSEIWTNNRYLHLQFFWYDSSCFSSLCIFLAFLNSLALGMWFANRIVLLLFCIR